MNTLTGGKAKKQAGLGDIDSRLAEIRDIFAGIFPAPPDKLVVVMFLLLYLEVFNGFLVHLGESAAAAAETLSPDDIGANGLLKAIRAQYFYKNFPGLLELQDKDKFIKNFRDVFEPLSKPVDATAIMDLESLIYLREEEICNRFMPVLSGSSLTPTGRLIVGTFLMFYLEVLYGFLEANDTGDFHSAASAITKEYCYSLHDRLLHGDLKDKFEAAFNQLNYDDIEIRKQLIREVETQIFYRLNPLIPF